MGFLGHTRGSRAVRRRNFRRREPAVAAGRGARCFSGRNRDKIRRLTRYKAQCRPSHVRNGARAARVLRLRAPTKESRRNNLAAGVRHRCPAILQKYAIRVWKVAIIRGHARRSLVDTSIRLLLHSRPIERSSSSRDRVCPPIVTHL